MSPFVLPLSLLFVNLYSEKKELGQFMVTSEKLHVFQ